MFMASPRLRSRKEVAHPEKSLLSATVGRITSAGTRVVVARHA